MAGTVNIQFVIKKVIMEQLVGCFNKNLGSILMKIQFKILKSIIYWEEFLHRMVILLNMLNLELLNVATVRLLECTIGV